MMEPIWQKCIEVLSDKDIMMIILQVILIVAILFGLNYALYVCYKKDQKYKAKELERLQREAQANNLHVTDEELKQDIQPQPWLIWAISVLICLDIWVVGAVITQVWALCFFEEVKDENSKRALFGDSFGAVNALISAFAFAGMLVAFFLQRYELRLQRKELQLTRNEMNDQTAQFEKQNETLLRQNFENTYFHMLELHKQNIQEILVNNITGRDAIIKLLDILKERYEATKKVLDGMTKGHYDRLGNFQGMMKTWNVDKKKDFSIKYAYGHFFYGKEYHVTINKSSDLRKVESIVAQNMGKMIPPKLSEAGLYCDQAFSSILGHYYRHIYQTVCFVDKQEILSEKEKYSYVKMLRAQLSDLEQVLFYYNAMSSMGEPWIRHEEGGFSLLMRYRMIKNIPHFLNYFFNDPRVQLKEEIDKWESVNSGKSFFEQLSQL